ncbi:MAG: Sua5/YciO/YrdC/YwlC family protein [Actinomycetota bacterium]|nr:Sua5/YciO/YrdC/YwlC family protein [Actinomycetota bacterium]
MAERFNLNNPSDTEFNEAVEAALRYIRAGEVIVAAAEHGYAYLANAFDKEAVNTIHILRGNPIGVALQVFIAEQKVALGITPTLTIQQQEVLNRFWPGLLSVTVKSQPGLTWNLGDERRLGKVNIRVPNRKFISAILQQSGPLVASSAALVGSKIILDLANLSVYESDIGAVFSEGTLTKGEPSTWLEFSEKEITLQRVGAISIEQLLPLIPTISTPNL